MTINTRTSPARFAIAVYFVAIAGALLIVGGLAWVLAYWTRPAPLNQARIEERLKNLREINATAAQTLDSFGWQDQSKGLVRLSISTAMDLVVRESKNPGAARSNLLARVDKANPPPPPPEPAKPSVYE